MRSILNAARALRWAGLEMSVQWNPAKSRFELDVNGELAVADCITNPKQWTVTHVIVPVALRGNGVASKLASGIVEHARREQGKIVPVCPFMASYFERHPEAKDVLKSE